MKPEHSCRLTSTSQFERTSLAMPRIARLTLAVFIALLALAGLCDRLAEARHQAKAGHAAPMAQAPEGSVAELYSTAQYIPTRCRRPVLGVTKQVDPTDLDTGGVVSITFVVTGLGPKPADVVLVHDVSGSMLEPDTPSGQTSLEVAKAAASAFVNQLPDTDRVAVVAYSDTARLALPLTRDVDAAIAVIRSLEAREDWHTNIGDGILAGYEELISSTRWTSKTAKAMVLLSDGNANRPSDDPRGYARGQARTAGECGILIYTLGFGRAVSETLMQDIAALGGGEYYSSPDSVEWGAIHEEIALELRNVVVTDVLLPGVDVDCNVLPDAWQCITGSGFTTITIPISNSERTADPLTLSFTATVNLAPGYEGPINTDGSGICYDGPGGMGRQCQSFDNPTVTVGGGIEGISLKLLGVDPDPEYHGDSTRLHYSVHNHDQDDGVISGTALIVDSLSRTLDETDFDLDPSEVIELWSPPFTVPQDIVITLTATATYGIPGVIAVSDPVTSTLCPNDVYEPDDDAGRARPIDPGVPQLHDFYISGDEDWVGIRLYPGDRSLYVFTAHPLGPNGVSICMTLYRGGTALTDCNSDDPQSAVQIRRMLSCAGADVCDYFLRVHSPSSADGCWTDYELSVVETPWDELEHIWLPAVLKSF